MPRKPTTVRIGRDSKGAYIKYGRQKIYISKSVQQRLAEGASGRSPMGRESLTEFLVKWIVKHFSRRRRRRRDRKASKEFGPPPKSIGTAGLSEAKVKSLPLESQRQHLVALSLLARPLTEQQRYLEDKRQEVKQSSDAKNNQRFIESTKDTPPHENSAMMRLALGQAAKEITELKRQIRQSLPQNIEGTQSYIAARQKEIEDLEKQQDQLRRKIDEVRDGTAYHTTQGDDSLNKQLKSLGVQPGKWSRKRSLQVLKERLEELDEDPAEKKAYSAALKKLPYLRDPEKYQEEIRKHDESITTINLQIRTAEDYLKELQKPQPGPVVDDLDDDYRTPPEAPASPPVSRNATILPPGAKGDVKVEEPEDSGAEDSDADDVMFHSESPRARIEGTLEGAGLKTRTEALTDEQIDDLMSDIPGYLGTICKDEIPGLTEDATLAWNAGRPFGFITLTLTRAQAAGSEFRLRPKDIATADDLGPVVKERKKGLKRPPEVGHWVAVACIPDTQQLAYYDSFGVPAPADIKVALKDMFDKIAPRTLLKFKENLIQEQSADTDNCGWFCIQFLLDMFHGRKFTEATPYNKVLESERNIEQFKKRVKPFSWL